MRKEKESVSINPRTGHSALMTEALGESEAFLAFQERLSRVAPINCPVLLIGERGTGIKGSSTAGYGNHDGQHEAVGQVIGIGVAPTAHSQVPPVIEHGDSIIEGARHPVYNGPTHIIPHGVHLDVAVLKHSPPDRPFGMDSRRTGC